MGDGSENQPPKKEGRRRVPDPPPPPPKNEGRRLVPDPPPLKKNGRLLPDPPPPSDSKWIFIPNPAELMSEKNFYEKEVHELSDVQLILACDAGGGFDLQTLRDEYPKLQKYRRQLEASEGFDLDENPKIGIPPGGIMKAPCDSESYPELYKEYVILAKFAIEDYNQKKNTEFVVSKVKSVNFIRSNYLTYFMTFTAANVAKDAAADSICMKTFQAKVVTCDNQIERFRDLEFCRLKDAANPRL